MRSRLRTSTKKQVLTGKEIDIDPRFAAIVQAFAKDPQVTYGKMMASVGLKVNAKIFAMMSKGKFVVKLPKVSQASFNPARASASILATAE